MSEDVRHVALDLAVRWHSRYPHSVAENLVLDTAESYLLFLTGEGRKPSQGEVSKNPSKQKKTTDF